MKSALESIKRLIWFVALSAAGLTPSPSYAQKTAIPGCLTQGLEKLIFPEKELEAKIRAHLKQLSVHDPKRRGEIVSFSDQFESLFSQIRTPDDALRIWRMIERLSQIEYTRNFGSWSSSAEYLRELLSDLARFDSVEPILRIQHHFSAEQRGEFLRLLDRTAATFDTQDTTLWNNFTASYRMLFEPDSILEYLARIGGRESLARNFAEEHEMQNFSKGTLTAIQNLPEETRLRAKAVALKQYRDTQALANAGIKDFGSGQDIKPAELEQFKNEAKRERRNWETLYRALTEPEFQAFFRGLQGRASVRWSELASQVETYWRSIGLGGNANSFKDVYSAARTIQQSSIGAGLKGEDLLLYGSFPNGKALPRSSDLDLHPSRGLMKKYVELFKDKHSQEGTFAKIPERRWDRSKPPVAAHKVSKQLVELERELARALRVHEYEPGSFMTMVLTRPAPPHEAQRDFWAREMINQYNPLTVRVTKTKIYLEVYDAYKSRTLQRIEILP